MLPHADIHTMDSLVFMLALMTAPAMLVFAIDDIFIDLVAWRNRLKPKSIDGRELTAMKREPQRRIAIMVANWHEHEVLPVMIRGNLQIIDYHNYMFFLGVYPNDWKTLAAATQLQNQYPERVTVVVNPRPGPTSKGQMLNEIVDRILEHKSTMASESFELILMQDSEDVLHPHSLTLLNHYSRKADFVQLPVFSFDLPWHMFVGGTYLEEFSESHTKELLVREHLGAAVPSAGVGTLISTKLAKAVIVERGSLLKEDTLTEDYHLGLSIKPLGFKSCFACVRLVNPDGTREFIATREYFPAKFTASVRQKTRWVLGIAFQGLKNLKWNGTLVDRYFMFRDRRGPLNSVVVVLSAVFCGTMFFDKIIADHEARLLIQPWFQTLLSINLGAAVWRVGQRIRAVRMTHSNRQAALTLLRWPVAWIVNAMASLRAYRQFRHSQSTGQAPAWAKTEHRMPELFGQESTREANLT